MPNHLAEDDQTAAALKSGKSFKRVPNPDTLTRRGRMVPAGSVGPDPRGRK